MICIWDMVTLVLYFWHHLLFLTHSPSCWPRRGVMSEHISGLLFILANTWTGFAITSLQEHSEPRRGSLLMCTPTRCRNQYLRTSPPCLSHSTATHVLSILEMRTLSHATELQLQRWYVQDRDFRKEDLQLPVKFFFPSPVIPVLEVDGHVEVQDWCEFKYSC